MDYVNPFEEVKTSGSPFKNKFWERYNHFIDSLVMIFKQDLEEIENVITITSMINHSKHH